MSSSRPLRKHPTMRVRQSRWVGAVSKYFQLMSTKRVNMHVWLRESFQLDSSYQPFMTYTLLWVADYASMLIKVHPELAVTQIVDLQYLRTIIDFRISLKTSAITICLPHPVQAQFHALYKLKIVSENLCSKATRNATSNPSILQPHLP